YAGMDAADAARTVVAYEPVWAIGTGRTATESGATFDWISDSIAEFGATPYFEYDVDEGTHGVWPVYPTDHGFHYTYTTMIFL
ncbi:triose-phosphate isomerase, partial [Adlercreutzia sp. DFI.6.23]|uniref:triose-phosphate isomerase n=1 Tax=Adlercreutzia sp. DFI.6.23 TaxID=2963705 RepID=UPI00210CF150